MTDKTPKQFASMDEFKSGAEFFKAGSIIPVRVLRCSDRRVRHHITFYKDAWVRSTPVGYICALNSGLGSLIEFKHAAKWTKGRKTFVGSPYGGESYFFGDLAGEQSQLDLINKTLRASND